MCEYLGVVAGKKNTKLVSPLINHQLPLLEWFYVLAANNKQNTLPELVVTDGNREYLGNFCRYLILKTNKIRT